MRRVGRVAAPPARRRCSAPAAPLSTSSRSRFSDAPVGTTPSQDCAAGEEDVQQQRGQHGLRRRPRRTTAGAAPAAGCRPAPARARHRRRARGSPSGSATMPLQENSATQPARSPSSGGPGRQARVAPGSSGRAPARRRASGAVVARPASLAFQPPLRRAPPPWRRGRRSRWCAAARSQPRPTSSTTAYAASPAAAKPDRAASPVGARRGGRARPASCRRAGSRRPSRWRASPCASCPSRASRSSCSGSDAPRAPACHPARRTAPVAVTRRTSKSCAARLRMIEAAALTAVSIEDWWP